jgi:hypothetical protein
MRATFVGKMRWVVMACLLGYGGMLSAQMVQYGYVVEMNSGGRSLPNVSVSVPMAHDCQPTASDARGLFRLCFGEHRVGDVVMGLSARKYGYELVNRHIVEGYTLTDRDSLRIVMAPIEKLKEARERYYALLENASIQRYDSTMAFLNGQYAQQIITKPELDYWQSLAEAELKFAYQNIDDYADHLARINEDDLDEAAWQYYDKLMVGDAEAGLALIGDMPESNVIDDYLVFIGTYPMTNPEVHVASGDFDLLNIPDSLYSDVVAFSGYNDRYESDFMTNGLHYAQSCHHLGTIFLSLDDPVMAADCFRKALKMYELLNEMDSGTYQEQIKELQRQIKSLE